MHSKSILFIFLNLLSPLLFAHETPNSTSERCNKKENCLDKLDPECSCIIKDPVVIDALASSIFIFLSSHFPEENDFLILKQMNEEYLRIMNEKLTFRNDQTKFKLAQKLVEETTKKSLSSTNNFTEKIQYIHELAEKLFKALEAQVNEKDESKENLIAFKHSYFEFYKRLTPLISLLK